MTFEWTLDSLDDDNTIQTFDWANYSVTDHEDGSLSIDALAFLPVAELEHYAFVLNGNGSFMNFFITFAMVNNCFMTVLAFSLFAEAF